MEDLRIAVVTGANRGIGLEIGRQLAKRGLSIVATARVESEARAAAGDARAILVNAACPGWVRSRMGGTSAPRSPAKGAETPVWLATLPAGGPTGDFFHDQHPTEW